MKLLKKRFIEESERKSIEVGNKMEAIQAKKILFDSLCFVFFLENSHLIPHPFSYINGFSFGKGEEFSVNHFFTDEKISKTIAANRTAP